MDNERLTVKSRVNGKPCHYSMYRKDELVERLGQYEDIIDTPEELVATLTAYDNTVQLLLCAIRNAVNAPEVEENKEKLRALVSAYDKILLSRAKAPKPSSEPSSAI